MPFTNPAVVNVVVVVVVVDTAAAVVLANLSNLKLFFEFFSHILPITYI